MKKIYQFSSQVHPERKTYYLFIVASRRSEAVNYANWKAKDENIPYVFGESDICFEEDMEEMTNGCFELIECDPKPDVYLFDKP